MKANSACLRSILPRVMDDGVGFIDQLQRVHEVKQLSNVARQEQRLP